MWGRPIGPMDLDWRRIQRDTEELVKQIEVLDRAATFGPLVGSQQLREAPVHRWFTYKEGYSPKLLPTVIEALGLRGDGLRVADAFGGVATTAVAGRVHPQVSEIRSLEYSSWARFAGATKLQWPDLDSQALRALLPSAIDYTLDHSLPFPGLAAFENPSLFHHKRVSALLSAREHLRSLNVSCELERNFFLLGLGAVVEDLSYAMKDGRALRMKGVRNRRPSSLADHPPALRVQGKVKQALMGQWTAMIEDLERLADQRKMAAATPAIHVSGDARALATALMPDEATPAFPDHWADLSCFSPPYLNCIDYSELYKLELWLLEHVSTQEQFRRTRLGTLRSHPSVKFNRRDSFAGVEENAVVQLVGRISEWLLARGARRDVGHVVQSYFEDMLEVWRCQHVLLAEDGVAVCVVANSTFSRREREGAIWLEQWRLPVLTDVLLAHLAILAGFARAEIWHARNLRPRNVRGGAARESLVVAFKGE
jgi:hypothetical protein